MPSRREIRAVGTVGARGVQFPPPRFWQKRCLTLFQSREQIMPTTLLLAPLPRIFRPSYGPRDFLISPWLETFEYTYKSRQGGEQGKKFLKEEKTCFCPRNHPISFSFQLQKFLNWKFLHSLLTRYSIFIQRPKPF